MEYAAALVGAIRENIEQYITSGDRDALARALHRWYQLDGVMYVKAASGVSEASWWPLPDMHDE